MSTDETGRYLVTGYVPKLALSVVGLTCFLVLAIIFWFRFWRSGKKWMLCLCIGTTTMAAGFGIRIPSTNDPYSISIYIPQTLFILLSPCAFLAQNYILLPRLATWLDSEDCLFMKSRIIVRTFVWADVITFLLQASGSGLTAMDNPSLQDVGHWIAVVGLIVQLLFFATFSILLLIFGYRVRNSTPWKWSNTVTTKAPGSDMTMTTRLGWLEDWRTLYWALVWTIIGFLVRSIFRIIEYAQGYDGELRTTEVYFYVLDSLPIFLALAVWTLVWPPLILTEHSKPFQDGNLHGSSNGYPLLAPNGGRLSDRHLSGNSAYGKV